MYEKSDKAISYIQKECIKLFRKLKTLQFDEANVLASTKTTYAKADETAQRAYLTLAESVYNDTYKEDDDYEAYLLGYIDGEDKIFKSNSKDNRKSSTNTSRSGSLNAWLQTKLNEYNPVTKYIWSHEVERKQARCAEALIATKSPKEVDNALKYWSQQTAQYSDDIEFGATILAYEDMGIEKVRWVTEADDRVCEICRARDGVEYDINDIPDKPHYGCRCWVEPVRERK